MNTRVDGVDCRIVTVLGLALGVDDLSMTGLITRESEAEASYVAGFPVPLPLPPGPSVRLD